MSLSLFTQPPTGKHHIPRDTFPRNRPHFVWILTGKINPFSKRPRVSQMQLERQAAQMLAHFCTKPVWEMKIAADLQISEMRRRIIQLEEEVGKLTPRANKCNDLEERIKEQNTQLRELAKTKSDNKMLTEDNEALRKSLDEVLDALSAQYTRNVKVLNHVHQSELQQVLDNWPGDEKPEPV